MLRVVFLPPLALVKKTPSSLDFCWMFSQSRGSSLVSWIYFLSSLSVSPSFLLSINLFFSFFLSSCLSFVVFHGFVWWPWPPSLPPHEKVWHTAYLFLPVRLTLHTLTHTYTHKHTRDERLSLGCFGHLAYRWLAAPSLTTPYVIHPHLLITPTPTPTYLPTSSPLQPKSQPMPN